MKDNIKLFIQAALLIGGPLLAKHGLSVDQNDVEAAGGAIATLWGLIWKFWHWNTTPSADQSQSVPITIHDAFPILALTAVLFGAIGCAHLQPGADPLVVNVERFETTAKGTFDFALALDKSLPENEAQDYHKFCDWLSAPQVVEQTNTLPRCYAMLLSLDDVKLDYKAARASSNDVYTAFATAQSVFNQTTAYLIIVTNKPSL